MRRRAPGLARSAKRLLRRCRERALTALGLRDPLLPPRERMFVGSGDFVAVGREFAGYLVDLAGLRPDDCLLDVGCGVGRLALPLTKYLGGRGRYAGFDVVADGIAWCQTITRRFPRFGFRLVDVRNRYYNPQGRLDAATFTFPFPGGSFDVAVLASVFTHLTPPDAGRYVAEVARALKPGGRCLATFFLLNDESRRLSEAGRARRRFVAERDGFATVNPDCPEEATAFDEAGVRLLFARHGLRIEEPVRYGSWCGRAEFLSHQDVVVAVKEAGA